MGDVGYVTLTAAILPFISHATGSTLSLRLLSKEELLTDAL
jgi:hypothetical protein